jgi:hypothetical protein
MSGPREFLALLDDDDRRALDELGTMRRATRGEVVVFEGQVADKVVALIRGRVKIVASTSSGDDVVLTFRGPGALIGEQALLDGSPRAATVVAVEPVEYLVVAASVFRAYLERRPRVGHVLLAVLSSVEMHGVGRDRPRRHHDHEELAAGLALGAEHLASRHVDVLGVAGHLDQMLLRQPRSWRGAQGLNLGVLSD